MLKNLIPKIGTKTKTRMYYKRNYQNHFRASINCGSQLGEHVREFDVLQMNNHQNQIIPEFYCMAGKTLQHVRAGILLRKLDFDQEILPTDYDNYLLGFINDFRKLGYADKSVYDKYDVFLERIGYVNQWMH
jgi:hypothetical protein